jgi:hypothetical protein
MSFPAIVSTAKPAGADAGTAPSSPRAPAEKTCTGADSMVYWMKRAERESINHKTEKTAGKNSMQNGKKI